MHGTEAWRKYADELLGKLESNGRMDTAALRDAFWAVPRHRFIDGLYEHRSARHWEWRPAPGIPEADQDWLARVYQDRPVITQINSANMPTCSNSAPSLVFGMLKTLRVSRGERVVEIGTGTGQMAALLGQLVAEHGDVVTLEVDTELAVKRAIVKTCGSRSFRRLPARRSRRVVR